MPPWANLVGAKLPGMKETDLAGAGVYACFWDGKLIYIGSFVGPEANPFGGHVADRIYKHVMGFTLRAKSLGFSSAPLRSIMDNLDHEIARDLAAARGASDRLEKGSVKATYNKARFAARHWTELRDASPEALFERFSFSYRRIAPNAPAEDKQTVKERRIKPLEKALIRRFEPICNTEFRLGPDGRPAELDEVAETFEAIFDAQHALEPPPGSMAASASASAPHRIDDEEDPEIDQMVPPDSRWQEYYTDGGQLRVRAVLANGSRRERTLLFRESNGRVISLADCARLTALGLEAKAVRRGPMVSSIAIDFAGDPVQRSKLLRNILEASLATLAA